MARLRTIKPGFFTDDELGELPPLARLLYAGLWCVADREGRLKDRPKRIKAEVLPYDDCDVDALLSLLTAGGFILRYEVGQKYIQIVSFSRHQMPHYKEVASVIPAPPGHVDSGVIAFGVSTEQRARIMERDGHKCVECGSTERLSIDHIIPRSRGGSGDDDNLRVLCLRHNTAKGNREAKATTAPSIKEGKPSSVQRRSNGGSTKAPDDPLSLGVVNGGGERSSVSAPPTGESAGKPAARPLRPVPKPTGGHLSAAVKAANVLLHMRCDETQRAEVDKIVPDTPEALATWEACLKEWRIRGHKIGLRGPLDWFADGIPPGKPQRNGTASNGAYVAPGTPKQAPPPELKMTPEEAARSDAALARLREMKAAGGIGAMRRSA